MKRRVYFISLLVVASALASARPVRQERETTREREATLKQDLRVMRDAIDNYTLGRKQAPQSLQDLVDRHYLKEIPTDPFTGRKDWVPQFDDAVLSPDKTVHGMVDVHSNSGQVGSIIDAPYNECATREPHRY